MPQLVLVTGAAGNLGSQVCKALWDAAFEVRTVDRAYRADLPVPVRVVDLLNETAIYGPVEGCDAVVHLANHPHPHSVRPGQRLYAENVRMNMNVFQAAADVGARKLVYSSSVQVLAGSRHDEEGVGEPSCLAYLPIDGDAPARPGNAYALSKEAGEAQLRYFARRNEGMSCTAIRYPFLMREEWMDWVRRHLRSEGSRRLGNLDEAFSYLAVPDAASLVVAVLERQESGYHQLFPAAPDNYLGMPIPELIEKYYPDVPLRIPAEQMTGLVDISAIEERLGWKPEMTDLFGAE
ncbi:MAG: NAD(P)-dependent oxidoreductase [Candidatus Brocadiaceae bacterium]|jgi:nucleoside-diphosphate-sugar epimerase